MWRVAGCTLMVLLATTAFAQVGGQREKCTSYGGAWESGRNRCLFYPNISEPARNECIVDGGTLEYSNIPRGWYCHPDNAERCKARGGSYTHVCSALAPFCLVPTADAGRVCTDSSQCEKGCLYVNRGRKTAPDEAIEGMCAPDNYPAICKYRNFVEKGRISPGAVE
jgi:hypothetical protein